MRAVQLLFIAIGLLLAIEVSAQQVTVQTPHHVVGDSFYENMGMSWGLRGKNWSFSFGGSPNEAAPQFGGYDPSSGANFGWGFNRGDVSGDFNFNWSQGFRRSFTSQVPSVTLQNGVPGYFSDTSISPFVISYIPVVGGFAPVSPYNMTPMSINPSAAPPMLEPFQQTQQQAPVAPWANNVDVNNPAPPARNAQPKPAPREDLVLIGNGPAHAENDLPSSAEVPAMSVEAARRAHAKEQGEQGDDVMAYIERAKNAEATGKSNVAKIYYQMALRRASGDQKTQILAKLQAMAAP